MHMSFVYIMNPSMFLHVNSSTLPITLSADCWNIMMAGVSIKQVQTLEELMTFIAFDDHAKAISFERYLKSHAGRAFSKKHF